MFTKGWHPDEENKKQESKPAPRFSPKIVAKIYGKPLTEISKDRVFKEDRPPTIPKIPRPKKEPKPIKEVKSKPMIDFKLPATPSPVRTSPIIVGEHEESDVKIYKSKDYRRFQFKNGNRVRNPNKIKNIKKDIAAGLNVLMLCPIVVVEQPDGYLEIADGQHRFIVSEETGDYVWYVIAASLSLLDIAKVNSNTERWKDKDFINCYEAQGNEHYRGLQNFMTAWGLPVTTSIQLLTSGVIDKDNGGAKGKQDFTDGKFEIKALEKANETMERVMLFNGFAGLKQRAFIAAICTIAKSGKISLEDLAEKFRKYPDDLTVQMNQKEYLLVLEKVYNKNKHSREVIY